MSINTDLRWSKEEKEKEKENDFIFDNGSNLL